MNKRNLQRELEKIIEKEAASRPQGDKPTLLLHVCCAPCSSYCLEYITQYFDVTVYFANSNIDIEEEYLRRREEEKRLISEMCPQVKFVEGNYDPQHFHELTKGHEHDEEQGERCDICFNMRLEEAAKYAAEHGFDYYTTTLTLSRRKDANHLCDIGEEIIRKMYSSASGDTLEGVKYLPTNFKKKGGDLRAIELSQQYGLYRQNYCGCSYSKDAAEKDT